MERPDWRRLPRATASKRLAASAAHVAPGLQESALATALLRKAALRLQLVPLLCFILFSSPFEKKQLRRLAKSPFPLPSSLHTQH